MNHSSLLLFALMCSSLVAVAETPKHIVDTHIHLYDTSRPEGVPWPRDKQSKLYRPYLPKEFHAAIKSSGVTATVIVEASHWPKDNDWVMKLVEGDDHFVAIVGSLKPSDPDFAEELDRLSKDPRFVGIRPRVEQGESPLAKEYLKGLSLLAEKGLTLDLLAHTFALKDVAEVARRLPKLRIVVDHLAGIGIDGKQPPQKWLDDIRMLSKHKNIYCKFSGIFQRSIPQPAPKRPDFYKPVFDAAWKQFGEDRLIYGSNWPVTVLTGKYEDQFQIIYGYVEPKGQPALEKVFWKNAAKVYRLKLK